MRIRKLVISCILLVLFAFGATAAGLEQYNLSIDTNDFDSVMTENNISQSEELVKSLGFTVSTMKTYFASNNLILFAANKDNSRQLQIKRKVTDFSRELSDLTTLTDADAAKIAGMIADTTKFTDYSTVTVNSMMMYEFVSTSNDSGGSFCSIQYVTVRDGYLYSVGFFENGDTLDDAFRDFAWKTVGTLHISKDSEITATDAADITMIILVAALIVAALIVAIVMTISFVRDIRNRSSSDDGRIVISRRRFKK